MIRTLMDSLDRQHKADRTELVMRRARIRGGRSPSNLTATNPGERTAAHREENARPPRATTDA
jgi:hypothetical protein